MIILYKRCYKNIKQKGRVYGRESKKNQSKSKSDR